MANEYSEVECWEDAESPQGEQWTREGATMQVTLRCEWENRHALVQDILENERPWPHGGFPNPPTAGSATIVPFITPNKENPATGQQLNYENALVTVTYDRDATQLVSESLEPNTEFITLDSRWFRWSSGDPISKNEAPGKLRRGLTLVRTQYKVQPPLSPQLITAVGGVNNRVYVSSFLGNLPFGIETLLFTPPNITRSITASGSDGFTVPTKFMYKPEGWNRFWRAETQQYERIVLLDGTPYLNHPLVNMSDLLP